MPTRKCPDAPTPRQCQTGVDVERTLPAKAADVAVGRRADLRGSRREEPESDGDRAFGVTRAASSLPEAGLRQSREKRLSLGDLEHFGRRRDAFERGGEDGVGVGGAAGAF